MSQSWFSPSIAWITAGTVVGLGLANEAVVVLVGPGFAYVTVRAFLVAVGALAHLGLVVRLLTHADSARAKWIAVASLAPSVAIVLLLWLYPFALFVHPTGIGLA